MLGSLSEADDAVQEAWLRLNGSNASEIENLGGWLTTVVARVCLNMLQSRQARREEPLSVHVPDPIVSVEADTTPERERCWRTPRGSRCRWCWTRWRRPSGWPAAGRYRGPGRRRGSRSRLGLVVHRALVNGTPGLVSTLNGRPFAVGGFMVANGKIVEIDILADPERLAQLDLAILEDGASDD
jgi:hypothetical protein